MKLSVFKESIVERLILFKALSVFSFQKETAYWTNNWTSVLSTTVYTLSALLFLNIIYANVKLVAGYSKNEMLLFFLVVQLGFFINWGIWYTNLREFIVSVNRGDLDLILTKPAPALFYLTFKKVKFFSILRDGIPPMLVILLVIQWNTLTLIWENILVGLIVFVLGMLSLHVFQFIAALPVFWLGQSENILGLSQAIEAGAKLTPWEGFKDNPLSAILGTVAPVLISAGFVTSVVLGKSDPAQILLWSFLVTSLALCLRNYCWKLALRSYTSASS